MLIYTVLTLHTVLTLFTVRTCCPHRRVCLSPKCYVCCRRTCFCHYIEMNKRWLYVFIQYFCALLIFHGPTLSSLLFSHLSYKICFLVLLYFIILFLHFLFFTVMRVGYLFRFSYSLFLDYPDLVSKHSFCVF
jgi:hypothetical protein